MITEVNGDLLQADVDALVNTVNTVGVMGKGIALQFKRAYPDNFQQYVAACRAGKVQVGRMFVVANPALTGPRWVINFPTKEHWKGRSRIEWVRNGLDDLIRTIEELGVSSIAVPPLGAGNGGLDWPVVRELIYSKLSALPDVAIHLFAPAASHRPIVGKPTRMTWGRATLIRLIAAYASARTMTEPWSVNSGASALEIQKLMYFASLRAPKLKLGFKPGKYGPYSDQVRHLMQEMEGSYLEGFGDGADPVLKFAVVKPTKAAMTKAQDLDASNDFGITAEIVDPIIALLEGFEGAYGLELLATVHWVRHNLSPSTDVAAVTEGVRSWSERKGRLFTEEHVRRAMVRLDADALTAV